MISHPLPPAAENKREVRKNKRELEREKASLAREEKKVIAEIKKAAKKGDKRTAKSLAKDLLRVRSMQVRVIARARALACRAFWSMQTSRLYARLCVFARLMYSCVLFVALQAKFVNMGSTLTSLDHRITARPANLLLLLVAS